MRCIYILPVKQCFKPQFVPVITTTLTSINSQFLSDAVVRAQHGGVRYAYFCSWLTTMQVIQLTWSEHSIVTSQCCTRQIAVQRFDCDEQMNGQTYRSVSIRVVLPHGIRRRVYCDSLILYNVDWLAFQYFRHSGFCSVRVSKRVSTWAATGFFAAERETAAVLLSLPQTTAARVCSKKICS